jgi:hypothetical protein
MAIVGCARFQFRLPGNFELLGFDVVGIGRLVGMISRATSTFRHSIFYLDQQCGTI